MFLPALQLQHSLMSTKPTASVAKTQAAIWLVSRTTELNLTGNIPRELSILWLPSSAHTQNPNLICGFLIQANQGTNLWRRKNFLLLFHHASTPANCPVELRGCFWAWAAVLLSIRFMGSNVKGLWEQDRPNGNGDEPAEVLASAGTAGVNEMERQTGD